MGFPAYQGETLIRAVGSPLLLALVAYAVKVGLWLPQRALSIAQRITDTGSKVKMLIGILTVSYPQLTPEQIALAQTQALQAAEQIKDEWIRAELLGQLAPQLSGKAKETALSQALQAAGQIEDEWSRASALGKLLLS